MRLTDQHATPEGARTNQRTQTPPRPPALHLVDQDTHPNQQATVQLAPPPHDVGHSPGTVTSSSHGTVQVLHTHPGTPADTHVGAQVMDTALRMVIVRRYLHAGIHPLPGTTRAGSIAHAPTHTGHVPTTIGVRELTTISHTLGTSASSLIAEAEDLARQMSTHPSARSSTRTPARLAPSRTA